MKATLAEEEKQPSGCLNLTFTLPILHPAVKKLHTTYVCQSCAFSSPRWVGKCPNCGAWNSLVEELARSGKAAAHASKVPIKGGPVPITEVEAFPEARMSTHLPECDRVLGGGIVPGSVILVGGDPGIGKSTLMMQVAASLRDRVVLYVTGEESVRQIKLRSERLDVRPSEKTLLFAETNLHVIGAVFERSIPDLVIVDSIQTMYRPELESAAGTVSQVREATSMFLRIAKEHNVPVFLVGHVTKEGVIAGPKVVEHMVDTVLQFEGERHYAYRILRAMKNRFGSTNEIGIFEMHDGGLREVTNPSQVFLAERKAGATGSAVVASIEGTRPLLLEVQALVAPTSYGVPQRSATGFDPRRLQMLLAVLEKRAGLHVGQYDVFVNVAGGVRIDEPAADLGMAASIVSSLKDVPVDARTVAVGEIGLGGEIRAVSQMEKRINEAAKLGFTRIVTPPGGLRAGRVPPGVEVREVESVDDALALLMG
jgi:DNA repair protein RadA/Sms